VSVDRSGNSLSIVAALSRIKTKDLHIVYDGKIKDKSTLCTDKMNSYVRFAKSNKIELVQLETGKSKRGVYHIQHINAYHSNLKNFIRIFKGVSTKYLNNYLLWNSWINVSEGSMQDKTNTLLRTAMSTIATVKCGELSSRPAIPLAN
jgi:transposase-like protein